MLKGLPLRSCSLGLWAFTADSMGLIPGQGTKTPTSYVVWPTPYPQNKNMFDVFRSWSHAPRWRPGDGLAATGQASFPAMPSLSPQGTLGGGLHTGRWGRGGPVPLILLPGAQEMLGELLTTSSLISLVKLPPSQSPSHLHPPAGHLPDRGLEMPPLLRNNQVL